MLKIKLTEDLGKKQLEDKWKGKFLDDSCYQKVIKIKDYCLLNMVEQIKIIILCCKIVRL